MEGTPKKRPNSISETNMSGVYIDEVSIEEMPMDRILGSVKQINNGLAEIKHRLANRVATLSGYRHVEPEEKEPVNPVSGRGPFINEMNKSTGGCIREISEILDLVRVMEEWGFSD